MKRCFLTPTLILLVALCLSPEVYAQDVTPGTEVETEKRAQTGFKFLSTSIDARASALGSAMTAEMSGSSVAMFYNPASMAGMEGQFHLNAAQTQFITDINYNIASVSFSPQGGQLGVFGLSLMSVDYGDFIGTVRADNAQGFEETGAFSPTALAIGVGYARMVTDRFAVGGHVKYALQDLGSFAINREGGALVNQDFDTSTMAFDFGVVYNTGFKSLTLGFVARNFSRELTYVRETFELPLTLQFGVSMNLLDFTSMNPDMHQLRANVDVQRPRDFSEHARFGLEYTFMDLLSLRSGFEQAGQGEEQGLSLGAGIHHTVNNIRIGADYAYTDFGIFGSLNRIALQIGL